MRAKKESIVFVHHSTAKTKKEDYSDRNLIRLSTKAKAGFVIEVFPSLVKDHRSDGAILVFVFSQVFFFSRLTMLMAQKTGFQTRCIGNRKTGPDSIDPTHIYRVAFFYVKQPQQESLISIRLAGAFPSLQIIQKWHGFRRKGCVFFQKRQFFSLM